MGMKKKTRLEIIKECLDNLKAGDSTDEWVEIAIHEIRVVMEETNNDKD